MRGEVSGRARAARGECLKSLAVKLLGGSALAAIALTFPGGPAGAQCVTTGTTVTCTGNGAVLDGVTDGVDFLAPPVTTINILNILGDITPGVGTSGVFAETLNDGESLTISVDIAPFQIITQGDTDRGIFARTVGDDSAIAITNLGAITTLGGQLVATSQAAGIYADTGDLTAGTGTNSGIDITNEGAIRTQGDRSPGILARTLVANSDVTIDNRGAISTLGSDSKAIFAVATGDNSGISVTNRGAIITLRGSDGIRAQATGRFSGGVTITNLGAITTVGGSGEGIYAQADGDDGVIDLENRGRITTAGAFAFGIYAQTGTSNIGANSGITVTNRAAITTQGDNAGAIFARTQSADSPIIIENRAAITTHGDNADGIFSETRGANSLLTPARQGYSGITIDNRAAITTHGDDADGIFSETRRADSPITITNTADVTANGMDADGIAVRILDASSPVTVNLNGGVVQGGTGTGAGVNLTDVVGASTLNTSGTVTLSALSGTAVLGGAGNTTINNSGVLTTVTNGAINLGGGTNAFNNLGGGLFNAGATVSLGGGNLFTNDGDLSPGGAGTIQVTTLTGNMIQNGGGLFTVDADLGATDSDLVNVSGTASLAGNVVAQIINPANVAQTTTILSSAGTTDNGLELIASPALQAELQFNGNDVDLAITGIDFLASGSGLDGTQTALANNLNAILGAGGGTVEPVLLGLLNGPQGVSAYLSALDQLLPEAYLNTETAGLFAAEDFNSNLLSCPQGGQGFTAVSQGQCMWVRYGGRWTDRDSTRQTVGYEEDAHGISGGGQVAVAPNWFVGVAAAYETSDLDTDTNASADTDRYMLGGVIKYQAGPALVAVAGSFGSGDVDMARRIAIGGFNATARSSFDVDHVGATFHAAYLMDRSRWYAKPFVDVNVIHVDRDSAQETGGGAANLNVSGSDETYFSVTPALELGTTIDRGDGRAIRPYVRAGVTFYGDTDQSLTAGFVGSPAGVGGFTTTSEFDDIFADIAAGVTLFHGDHGTVSAGYEGRFSDDTDVHGFFVKGTRTF